MEAQPQMTKGTYADYAAAVLAGHEKRGPAERYLLLDAVRDLRPQRVLDLGCGPGQELLPFAEQTRAVCVGIDIAEELGKIAVPFFRDKGYSEQSHFVRGRGEYLPFADGSFDVVLCRVALPYMNNRLTLAEVARVLAVNGTFLLKIHAPAFYFGMIRQRLGSLNAKQLAYPLICLTASLWHSATGRQLEGGLWHGKEIFQTRSFLKSECAKHGLTIEGELPDTNPQSPSFKIRKHRSVHEI